jgi:MSHA pilin protein MshC
MTIGQYKRFAGFTLIELTMVIVLIGVMSVIGLGRLSSPDQFAVKAFFNDTVNALRFAQKLAVSTGCDVRANITTDGYQLFRSTTCTADNFTEAVEHPANRSNDYLNLATGFAVAPQTSVTFTARGTTDTGNTLAYTITGNGTDYTFTVFGQTGLINVP